MSLNDRVTITIADKLYIPIPNGINNTKLQRGLDLLVYDNPEYFQRMNMGLSTRFTPKTIKTYWLDRDTRSIVVLRGEYQKLLPYISDHNFKINHPPHSPINITYHNPEFELDTLQQEAVNKIVAAKQGIIHAVTSAGKTLIILKAISKLNTRALIVVNRKILMQQFQEDIEKYLTDDSGRPVKPSKISDGMVEVGNITLAIDKTLYRHLGTLKDKFGVVFVDECHLTPAKTMLEIVNNLNTEFRYGVTGTLKRKDQKDFLIYSTFGKVLYTINKDQLIAMGRIVPVETTIVTSNTKFNFSEIMGQVGVTKAYQLLEQSLQLDEERNDIILHTLKNISGKTIVLSRLVDPCYKLSTALQEKYNIKSGIITGKNSKESLESYNQMKHGDLQIIFATVGCVSTGVSISDLHNIILISPIYNNELLIHQIRGRLMRAHESKTKGNLYFIYDQYIFEEYKLQRFLNIMNK
jgi:superfamily II DNA or RNA helicase